MRGALGTGALAIALFLCARLFDAEPLYVPAVAFLALAVVAVAWISLSARGVRVSRHLAARRVVEDEPLESLLEVRAGRLPLPSGLIVDPLLEGPVPLALGRRGQRVRVRVRFARRGRRQLAAPQAQLRDPLGLMARTVAGRGDGEVLVLPRVEPVRAAAGAGDDRSGVRRRAPLAAEVQFDGVREHRPGTSASRIYWPALARGAGLMERRLRADADSSPLVVLDPRGAEREEDLDAAVRACASLAVALARAGGCGVLLPGDRRATVVGPDLGAWPRLHARLALVRDGGRPSLAGVAARQGTVFFVAAMARSRPPRALAHSPAAGRVLVVPGTLPGRRATFSVAGCHGYALDAAVPARGAA